VSWGEPWALAGPTRLTAAYGLPMGADFLRARDNPGYCVTWANARKRLLTCVVG